MTCDLDTARQPSCTVCLVSQMLGLLVDTLCLVTGCSWAKPGSLWTSLSRSVHVIVWSYRGSRVFRWDPSAAVGSLQESVSVVSRQPRSAPTTPTSSGTDRKMDKAPTTRCCDHMMIMVVVRYCYDSSIIFMIEFMMLLWLYDDSIVFLVLG